MPEQELPGWALLLKKLMAEIEEEQDNEGVEKEGSST